MRARVAAIAMLVGCGFRSPTGGGQLGDGAIGGDGGGGGDDGGAGDSAPPDRMYRRMLMLEASSLASPLDGFPVLVTLGATCAIDFGKLQAAGQDLRFVDADGAPLPHEIERWDPTAPRQIWVRVPQLFGADHIWMYYGDVTASDAQDPPAVWAGYLGVWHFATTTPVNSVNGVAATSNGGMANSESQVGLGLTFDGSNDWVDVGDLAGIDGSSQLTATVWVRTGSEGTSRAVFSKRDGAGAAVALTTHTAAKRIQARVQTTSSSYSVADTQANLITTGVWGHWGFTFDSSVLAIYYDGASRSLNQSLQNAASSTPNTDNLEIGRSAMFAGTLDEIRFSNVVRGDAWVEMEYRSMTGALVTCGGEEAL